MNVCPLCGGDNACARSTRCWCTTVNVLWAALRVKPEDRGGCVCRACAARCAAEARDAGLVLPTLSPADTEAILAALADPPEPNDALKAAWRAHRKA